MCDFNSRRTTWCVSRSLSSRARTAPRALDPLASLPRRRGSRRKSHRPLRAPSRFPQPAVPETALKRRKRDDAWAAKKAAADAEAKAKAEKNSRRSSPARRSVKEYRDQVSIRHDRSFRARQRRPENTMFLARRAGRRDRARTARSRERPRRSTPLAPPSRVARAPRSSACRSLPRNASPGARVRGRLSPTRAFSRAPPRREGRLSKTRPGLSTVHRSSVSLPRPPLTTSHPRRSFAFAIAGG